MLAFPPPQARWSSFRPLWAPGGSGQAWRGMGWEGGGDTDHPSNPCQSSIYSKLQTERERERGKKRGGNRCIDVFGICEEEYWFFAIFCVVPVVKVPICTTENRAKKNNKSCEKGFFCTVRISLLFCGVSRSITNFTLTQINTSPNPPEHFQLLPRL